MKRLYVVLTALLAASQVQALDAGGVTIGAQLEPGCHQRAVRLLDLNSDATICADASGHIESAVFKLPLDFAGTLASGAIAKWGQPTSRGGDAAAFVLDWGFRDGSHASVMAAEYVGSSLTIQSAAAAKREAAGRASL